jgi:hypothetical protein
VYLPAIEGHVPVEIIRCFRAFLEFCYTARQNIHNEKTIQDLQDALARFHRYRNIFQTSGVRPEGFSLPRQHSMVHYPALIRAFGAPNGLCSSITESKHIKAVKEPWRRSNCWKALGQMLLTNQRLDKLDALRADYTRRGMLDGTCLSNVLIECEYFYEYLISANILEQGDRTILAEDQHEDQPGSAAILSNVDINNRTRDNEQDEDADNAVDGPPISSYVYLSRGIGMTYPLCLLVSNY